MVCNSNYLPSGNQYYKRTKENNWQNSTTEKHIAIKPESRYVRHSNPPISNDYRTFRSPCKHINTKHFIIHICHNNTQNPGTKSTINKLQKENRAKINQESTISWERFCNSISLESDPTKSWRKITNFFEPKGPRSYSTHR